MSVIKVNGNTELVLKSDSEGAISLIRQYMGDDMADHMEELFKEYNEKIEELESDMESLEDTLKDIEDTLFTAKGKITGVENFDELVEVIENVYDMAS